MIKIGQVHAWDNDIVIVAIQNKQYMPSFGDLLYTVESYGDTNRTILMEVVGFSGQAPQSSIPIDVQSPVVQLDTVMLAHARLFIEITKTKNSEIILAKASRPPLLTSPVYLVRKGDIDSEEIMRDISNYSLSKKGVNRKSLGIVVLRAGIAHNESLAKLKYFYNASFNVNLMDLLRKHVLVVGQTGSGKTSGIQGILLRYALDSDEKIGWLIIDRHGEYTPPEGYVRDRFIGFFVDALRTNHNLIQDVNVKVFKLVKNHGDLGNVATVPGKLDVSYSPIDARSITFMDFAGLEQVTFERSSMIEEFISVLIELLRKYQSRSYSTESAKKSIYINPASITRVLLEKDDPGYATGNMLALVPLIVDNFIRYEGVGESSKNKRGIHKMLVSRGIDAKSSRMLRRLVLDVMGWRVKTHVTSKGGSIVVLDDSNSVVKVSETLKNPVELACLFEALKSELVNPSREYPWLDMCTSEQPVVIRESSGLDISRVVDEVDNGNVVIFDVSQLDVVQGDLAILTLVRRIFEKRLEAGVEVSRHKPVVSIVSEEAPLYLGPERVRSPFNPFARIAREGRKFGIGLVAITQMASLIEKQLLGNFNTIIVMRTKSSSDLGLMRDIGVPAETLPFLGDREGFIYTPDLPIKEPVPVYIPAWFDEIYAKEIENRRAELLTDRIRAPKSLIDELD